MPSGPRTDPAMVDLASGRLVRLRAVWVPRSAPEIEDAAQAGSLVEGPSFDAKADLPPARKNADVAKDVAAMATDGGVLLYGVGEDEHGNPTQPEPILLAGAPERVAQIVSTAITEVPFIDVRTFQRADDPTSGYLVVIVPQSARAPHMVVVGGDHRYYGRDAKGNRVLSEADVARLYERRQRWGVDREQVLVEVLRSAPVMPVAGRGYVHAFTRPAAQDPGIFERAIEAFGGSSSAHQRLLNTVNAAELRGTYGPSLESASYWRRHGGDMWRLSNYGPDDLAHVNAAPDTERDPTNIVVIDLNLDGRGQLFCGRATDSMIDAPDHRYVIEVVIAGNVEVFFKAMGDVYEAANYHGAVDVGLALTGLVGAHSERRRRSLHPGPPYPVDTYSRTDRVAAAELRTAPDLSQRLLRHFFEASTGIDGYNPWTQPQNR